MLDNNEEDLSKVLSYQIRIDNTEGIKNVIREGDKPVNRGIPQYRSLAHAIFNGCSQASLEALVEGGAEVAKGYDPQSDDLMLLLDSDYRGRHYVSRLDNIDRGVAKIDTGKVQFLLDKGANIVDNLYPLQDKIIASINKRQIDKKFNRFNDFPVTFLEGDYPVSGDDYHQWNTMMNKVSKFQHRHMDDTFNLVKHFFVHRMHNDIKDESDRRLWQLHISTFKEKGRVIMLQYVFQKYLQDTTSDRSVSYTHYTTLNHIFQRENLIYDIEGVINSAQLIIKQKKNLL
ncbi:hypothetical protein [Candidatus Mesenet endosymbiont of Agriotes lineatus]|uniref:hypothetical protein n=1 Tax=Candidatus Mesenet endosymbiont of Agriotes lineatus TaxID=3077948 RepID=UPI0030CF19A5